MTKRRATASADPKAAESLESVAHRQVSRHPVPRTHLKARERTHAKAHESQEHESTSTGSMREGNRVFSRSCGQARGSGSGWFKASYSGQAPRKDSGCHRAPLPLGQERMWQIAEHSSPCIKHVVMLMTSNKQYSCRFTAHLLLARCLCDRLMLQALPPGCIPGHGLAQHLRRGQHSLQWKRWEAVDGVGSQNSGPCVCLQHVDTRTPWSRVQVTCTPHMLTLGVNP